MKFVNPRNAPPSDDRIPYWDERRAAGLTGAIPPAKVFTDPQDEILKVITMAGFTPDPDDSTQLWQAIQKLLADVVAGVSPPITVAPGIIAMHAAVTPPAGWLKCNGQAVNRTTFANLFTTIGITWGAGNGVDTFNVPDFRGEFVRGFDDGRGIDILPAARAFASFQDWATGAPKTTTPSRLNGDGTTSALKGASNPSRVGFARAGKVGEAVSVKDRDALDAGIEPDSFNTATGDAETRPRNLAALFIIKT